MYVLLTGKAPYRGKNSDSILRELKANPFQINSENSQGLSNEAKSLLRSLLMINPEYRVSAKDAIKHP
jgi:Protein kinase domain.